MHSAAPSSSSSVFMYLGNIIYDLFETSRQSCIFVYIIIKLDGICVSGAKCYMGMRERRL